MSVEPPVEVSAVRAMPIREIRNELNKRGVNMAGCLEKSELVALLLENWHLEPSHTVPPPPAAGPTSGGGGGGASAGDGGSSSTLPSTGRSSSGSSGSQPPAGSSGSGSVRVKRMSLNKPCENCSNDQGKMLHCSTCGSGAYCSKECQVACWPDHKKVCKLRMEAKQEAKGMAAHMGVALRAWSDRSLHSLTCLAAATLWLPGPPRNASHILLLELHCENTSAAKPKFAVQSHKVITLEEAYKYVLESSHGDLSNGPPNRMLVCLAWTTWCNSKTASSSPSGPKQRMSCITPVELGPSLQSDLATGRQELPSLDSLIAELSQFS